MWLKVTCSKSLDRQTSASHISHSEWKQGDALSPLHFNFALQLVISRILPNQEKLEPNWTHQCLVCVHNVNLLDKNMHTIKKSTEALLVTSKEIGLEANIH
jgi:hypothetical protein